MVAERLVGIAFEPLQPGEQQRLSGWHRIRRGRGCSTRNGRRFVGGWWRLHLRRRGGGRGGRRFIGQALGGKTIRDKSLWRVRRQLGRQWNGDLRRRRW